MSFIVCVDLCAVLFQRDVICCVMCIIDVLCLVVVPLPSGRNQFVVQINNNYNPVQTQSLITQTHENILISFSTVGEM